MGKHGHYRVCIDGEKDHSSGGIFREELNNWIQENIGKPITEAPILTSKTPNHDTDIVVFLITRCNSGYRRRLDGILFSITDKMTQKNVTKFYPMKKYFDTTIPEEKEEYDNLGKTYSPTNIAIYGICQKR